MRHLLTLGIGLALVHPGVSQGVQLRHWTGQGVAPVFEGYDTNPDGSFNMWFGYMNRNYEEEPDIPVGPDNNFQPGNADRGQPTHFTIRRHKDVFSVVVPKDFGDQKLVWTLDGSWADLASFRDPKPGVDDRPEIHDPRRGYQESVFQFAPGSDFGFR